MPNAFESGKPNGELLHFRRNESGVDINANKPPGEGFGRELHLHSLPSDLQAETTLDLQPDSLHFEPSAQLPPRTA